MNLKEKIDKFYKENNEQIWDNSVKDQDHPKVPIKNVEDLITHMIKQHYMWDEITAVVGILRKGKGEDLIKIIKDTIS